MSTLNSPVADLKLLDEIFGIIKPRLAYMRGFVQSPASENSVSKGAYYLPIVSWAVVDADGKKVCDLEIQLNRREEWQYGFMRTATSGFWSVKESRDMLARIQDELYEGEELHTGDGQSIVSTAYELVLLLELCLRCSVAAKQADLVTDRARLGDVNRLIRRHVP